MSQFPEQFGKYVLLRKIAKGGMAEIFLAKNVGAEGFEKDLVIKRILPHYSEDEEFVTMFIDEASIASKLQHANVVQIYDFNQIEGSYYIAMEYVNGKDLKDVIADGIRRRKPLSPAQSVSIIIELAKALHYAHTKTFAGTPLNIVHRDVSPQNAMISFGGEVKLMDFGIAKAASRSTHTVAGTVKGKCAYMSPEQAKGKALDGRSDMFALGVVLWEMLTAKRLFLADSDFMTLTNVLKQEAPPPSSINPDVPPELDMILLKALEKDRDGRYPDAQGFERALTRWFYSNADLDAARLSPYMMGMYASDIAVNKAKATEERTMFLHGDDIPGGNPAPAPDEATRALPGLHDPQAVNTMMDGQIGGNDVAQLRAMAESAGSVDHNDATRMLGAMPEPAADQATRMLDAMPDDIRDLMPPSSVAPLAVMSDQPPASKAWLWMTMALVLLAIGGGVAAWYFLAGPGATSPNGGGEQVAEADTGESPEDEDADSGVKRDEDTGTNSGDNADAGSTVVANADAGSDAAALAAATDTGGPSPDSRIDGAVGAADTAAAMDTAGSAAGVGDAGAGAGPDTAAAAPDAGTSDTGLSAGGTQAVDAGSAGGTGSGDTGGTAPGPKKTQILVACDPDGQVTTDVGTVEHQGMMWVIKDVVVDKPVKIKCYRAGYATQAQDVVAQDGLNIPFKLQKISAGYGGIRVQAKPWARCSVASKKNATTPVKLARVRAGRYRVVCKFKDKTQKRVVTVKANRTSKVFFKFK